MKAIIDGKRYDTETALCVCDVSPNGFYRGDFRYEDTHIYRTRRGAWFLAGNGGPLSRWARSVGLNGSCSGSGIQPLDADEARAMLEQHALPEVVESHFGTQIVDA
jgi:hypothetical protein